MKYKRQLNPELYLVQVKKSFHIFFLQMDHSIFSVRA
jgi:hypothetical protein